jgi:hypothetical protein
MAKMSKPEYDKHRWHQPLYLARLIYRTQVTKSRKRSHPAPVYTIELFVGWLLNHPEFPKIYMDWVKSGYHKDYRPSVDRLDNGKGYSFQNIRLTTWVDNDRKGVEQRSCPVEMLDETDVVIKEYCSIAEAARATGIKGVSQVICGAAKTAGGFKWRKKTIQ